MISPLTFFPFAAHAATASAAERNLSTADRIARLERLTRSDPKNGAQWHELGTAYVRRAFETADPAFYPLAGSSLDRAQRLLGGSLEVTTTQATLALARHRFAEARSLATTVVSARPDALDARIALFDADVELGSYDTAFASIDALVAQRPNVATLSRLSYRRQLAGDLRGAEIAMRQAVSAAPAGSIDQAIALGYLGDVLFEAGRLDAAGRAYDRSARIDAANGTATIGQARVAFARGDTTRATYLLDRLVDRNPLPGALGLRADIARAVRDTNTAVATDQLVDATVALFRASGSVVDAELALLLADRGAASAPDALAAAKRAYAERRTMFTNDAMAWSLFVSGRPNDALPYARAAVAMQPGISSIRWHAAEVFAATGNNADARTEAAAALRNPWSLPQQTTALAALAKRLGIPAASTVALAEPSTTPLPTRLPRGA